MVKDPAQTPPMKNLLSGGSLDSIEASHMQQFILLVVPYPRTLGLRGGSRRVHLRSANGRNDSASGLNGYLWHYSVCCVLFARVEDDFFSCLVGLVQT